MQPVRVSVPGKMILVGEHSGVYGEPMLITGVGLRLSVFIVPRTDSTVTISSNEKTVSLVLDQLHEKLLKAEEDLSHYEKTMEASDLKNITKKLEDYPFLVIAKNIPENTRHGFDVSISSDIPIQSGLGSSAALAVAITGAFDAYFHKRISKDRIFEKARDCERFKHGFPSGGDVAGVLYGRVVWFEKKEKSLISPLDISIPKEINDRIVLVNTGVPVETTGEMVGNVRNLYNAHKEQIGKIFQDQGVLAKNLLEAIKKNDGEEFRTLISKAERNLEALGVVSKRVQEFICSVEGVGGAAKICGGGGTKDGTGIVLTYTDRKKELGEIVKSFGYTLIEVRLGEKGMLQE